jgi:hypothetical protein
MKECYGQMGLQQIYLSEPGYKSVILFEKIFIKIHYGFNSNASTYCKDASADVASIVLSKSP